VAASAFHLAQLNIGRLLAPIDDARIAGFVEQLAPINALAEGSPGYIWRLQSSEGDATSIRAFDDELMIVNLTVWESLEALRAFTYTTAHVDVLRGRRDWFERLSEAHLVLWWIPAGTLPTLGEAIGRLDTLRRDGPTDIAFTFRAPFPAPKVVEIETV
jgi:heme-degrading monooxygenase HmoA